MRVHIGQKSIILQSGPERTAQLSTLAKPSGEFFLLEKRWQRYTPLSASVELRWNRLIVLGFKGISILENLTWTSLISLVKKKKKPKEQFHFLKKPEKPKFQCQDRVRKHCDWKHHKLARDVHRTGQEGSAVGH